MKGGKHMAKTRKNKGPRPRRQPARPLEGNRIRVRTKRLDQVDESKITLAFWLLAKQLASDESDGRTLTAEDVQREAQKLEADEGEGRS